MLCTMFEISCSHLYDLILVLNQHLIHGDEINLLIPVGAHDPALVRHDWYNVMIND